MKFLFIFLSLSLSLYAQVGSKYDSFHSIILDADIDEGIIYSNSSNPRVLKYEIKQQLKYTVGLFNGFNSVASLNSGDILITKVDEIRKGRFKVNYSIKFILAWDKEIEMPQNFQIIIPESGNKQTINRFLNRYGNRDECLGPHAKDISTINHFYHFRPYSKNCQLKNRVPGDLDSAVSFNASFSLSSKQTINKAPEYHKIWEDGKLKAIFLFSTVYKKPKEYDYGVSNLKSFYSKLQREFGTPVYLTLPDGELPSLKNNFFDVHFIKDGVRYEFSLRLTNHLAYEGEDFNEWYSQRTIDADLISYGGHAGLGVNIKSLSNRGLFIPGQYRIFNMNGCDTFAYITETLINRIHQLNPDESPTKYVDLITTAMPGYFSQINRTHFEVLKSLMTRKDTYKEILSKLHTSQKSLVLGEEDNN